MLDEGKISERGSHSELMALAGTYARLFGLQAGGYELTADPSAASTT